MKARHGGLVYWVTLLILASLFLCLGVYFRLPENLIGVLVGLLSPAVALILGICTTLYGDPE